METDQPCKKRRERCMKLGDIRRKLKIQLFKRSRGQNKCTQDHWKVSDEENNKTNEAAQNLCSLNLLGVIIVVRFVAALILSIISCLSYTYIPFNFHPHSCKILHSGPYLNSFCILLSTNLDILNFKPNLAPEAVLFNSQIYI